MEALLMSLASCMAIDINVILEKSRVLVEELEVDVLGVRATEQPQRFTSLRVLITVEGPTERDQPKLERAAQLSHDKYCSVFHTLRSDLEVEVSAVRA
jgi:putative redox protein